MTRWKDDSIERAIDHKQDGLDGNRLRLFAAGGELAVRRRWFKCRFLPLATGKSAKLISFRAGVEVTDYAWLNRTVHPPEILAGSPVLAWLECRTWAIFGHCVLTWQADAWTCHAAPVYQTPAGVDPVGVLGFERAMVGAGEPDARILAQYDAWLAVRAVGWTRAGWVRERLGKVLTA